MNIIESILKGLYVPALLSNLLRSKLPALEDTNALFGEYDYIVVGSGPGGSVVANRLSEDPNIKVLLLEAGTKDNITSELPSGALILLTDGYDWFYPTSPQKNVCFNNPSKRCYLSVGKVIGGSTAINFMINSRGNKLDYDEWSENGNSGWSYEEILPYFKKHENLIIDGKCSETKYHGCDGDLMVKQLAPQTERNLTRDFLAAMQNLGYKVIDPSGEQQIGVTRGYFTTNGNARISAATAFLRPVQNRKNLHIVLEAFVHKVLIDSEKKSAIGVEFEKNGEIKQIKAKKEVILSAGSLSSPKILMLSGIGPKEELEKFKIPVMMNLPGVGQNLQEFISYPVFATTGRHLTEEESEVLNVRTVKDWQQGKDGILSTPTGFDAYAFVKTKYQTEDKPDIKLLLSAVPLYDIFEDFTKRGSNMTDDLWNSYFKPLVNTDVFTIFPILLHTKSKGTVTLRSSDPRDYPSIDPNYFANDDEYKRLVEGIRIAQKVVDSPPYTEKGYKFYSKSLEPCKEHEFNSDEYLKCTFQYVVRGTWNSCCTNSMGPDTNKMSVVDHRLRVKGIKGLRVADASIFPSQISSWPAATVYMVGEKAAAMIKEDN